MEKENKKNQTVKTFFSKHLKVFYPNLIINLKKPEKVRMVEDTGTHYSPTKIQQCYDGFIRKMKKKQKKARRLGRYHRRLNRLRG